MRAVPGSSATGERLVPQAVVLRLQGIDPSAGGTDRWHTGRVPRAKEAQPSRLGSPGCWLRPCRVPHAAAAASPAGPPAGARSPLSLDSSPSADDSFARLLTAAWPRWSVTGGPGRVVLVRGGAGSQ